MKNIINYDLNNIYGTLKRNNYKETENLYNVLNSFIKRAGNVKEINGREIFDKNKKIILSRGMIVKVLCKEEIVKFGKEYKDYDQLSDEEKKSYEIEAIKENIKI